jgi:hypothetical protein
MDHCLQIVSPRQYVVAQIKQAKIKIQIVLKLPLNPKSALKPLASLSWDQ